MAQSRIGQGEGEGERVEREREERGERGRERREEREVDETSEIFWERVKIPRDFPPKLAIGNRVLKDRENRVCTNLRTKKSHARPLFSGKN